MPTITKINHWEKGDRYFVEIDGKPILREDGKKFSIRGNVFPGMKIKMGTEITCAQLIDFETYVYKRLYGPHSWEKEKVRINKVKEIIESIHPEVEVHIVGFGADSTDELSFHPEESGSPMLVEVTGTERMREIDKSEYWIRPDKLKYIENHPEKNIWILLHFAEPVELIAYIKPIRGKNYNIEIETIREVHEKYVKLTDTSEETKSYEDFKKELLSSFI
jgi:ribosomal protein L20A (L18A)